MALEDRAIYCGGRIQGLLQNEVRDLSLLVAEELAQRKRFLALYLIEQTDYFGCVGLGKSRDQFLLILVG